MANDKIDLWPKDIVPKTVLTPLVVLRQQASLLKEKSGGRLEGGVTDEIKEDKRFLYFSIDAPTIDYTVRIFYCFHDRDLPYPVDGGITASDQDSFMRGVAKILASEAVRATIHALIARVTEEQLKAGYEP